MSTYLFRYSPEAKNLKYLVNRVYIDISTHIIIIYDPDISNAYIIHTV